ncbi:diaminopimelate decarboxylase family protein [Bifidobacterium tibiigranuli]|jgi:diaminopimelate decarboxylase|uniref:diaminopimelate decarboxylase family protein n=1 Tax=Bifidobacterium tibiigranuli TaxID=2172043 RepID=UPI0023533E8F|nr:diaminopimelate decarboxylase [Bifidobacterium tibiigranuli]MCI1211867.1 diaminopimelate decarboxylase [Bifidobacterium tibiigranuli]MCI1222138.1 diaminopimelate decarboxylase [Bifidobacterium tibiigranuli]MCI1792264.1 diaminopimelate decarboxylase [Bifidobacterium tibiigranuli]MCI1797731.1 diaminopimelate decarboxylase [Bifidobacterium tibiigranuli]
MGVTPIWPEATDINDSGEMTFHGRTASSLLSEFGSPLYVMDTDEVSARARRFVAAAAKAFRNTTTHASYAGKAFLSKEVVRIVAQAGMFVDTCSIGEMRIALAAGIPGRRLVLHGNNKSDEEIALAVEQGFAKIVVDEPGEPARIAAIAHKLGKRAKVMLRVTSGIHAGGHEYISTAHEDQKFGVALLPAGTPTAVLGILDDMIAATPAVTNARIMPKRQDVASDTASDAAADSAAAQQQRLTEQRDSQDSQDSQERRLQYDVRYPYDLHGNEVSATDRALADAMQAVADGPAHAVLATIAGLSDDLELVGIHSHIGSQIHDANAFIEAAKRMMLLRKTFYATNAYTLPEVDLGGGYSVAYTDAEDAMDINVELGRLADAVTATNDALGMPAPVISFEPGRYIAAPSGVTLYRVGAIKHVALPQGTTAQDGSAINERAYVSVDGGMSDNIRPALYDADYAVRLASRSGAPETMLARVVGTHCESGDILVHECQLPADITRGDILAIPVTGAYGRTMASNYNQALIPAVVAVGESGAHVMIRRQTIDDLLSWDVS